MKHIIYLHPHFVLPWWAGNYILETAKLISQKKWYKVYIISWKQNSKIIKWFKDVDFIETKIPLSSSFFFWLLFPIRTMKIFKNIKNIIKKNEWEFTIFAHVFPANWWWGIFKLLNKKYKFVFMCHEPSAFIWEKKWINSIPSQTKKLIAKVINPLMKIIDKKLIKNSDIIISNSKFTSQKAVYIYWKNKDIAYPWYDETKFLNKKVKKEKYFLNVGRLTKFKRVGFIVDSFIAFHNLNKDYILKIIWEWEELETLKEYVKQKWLGKKIHFLLSVNKNELISYYQKAYATLFWSIDEPFWMVPIESMACGTIAIWHNSWWMKETIPEEFRYENKSIFSIYPEEQWGIAPGQTLTAYIGDECIGSGIIE